MDLQTSTRVVGVVLAAGAALLFAQNAVAISDLPGVTAPPIAAPQDRTSTPVEPPSGTAGPAGLTPGTRRAYQAAAAAMRDDGIEMTLSSGYRSRDEQQGLYDRAITKYGSPEAARVWVLPPDESQHVRGVAVDVAPRRAARWLDRHGARFGLCRTMEWEWWHFEYDAAWAREGSCPPARERP